MHLPNAVSSYTLDERTERAIGRTEMYIMTSRLNWTPGLTLVKLEVEVSVCREDAGGCP